MAQSPHRHSGSVDSTSAELQPVSRMHIWQIQAVRDVLLIAALIALVWAGYAMRAVTVPLLIALLLAYLFEPLVSSLTRRLQTSRPMVVGGLLVTVGGAALILLAIIIPLLIGQTVKFVHDVRDGRFQNSMLKLKSVVPQEYHADFERVVQWVMPGGEESIDDEVGSDPSSNASGNGATQEATPAPMATHDERLRQIVREELASQSATGSGVPAAGSIVDLVRSGGRAVFGFIGTVVQLGLLAFLIPFYFFFFSVAFPSVAKFGRDLIPHASQPRAMELIGKMDRAVAGFVRGRIVICFIVGVILAVGWLICGVPYAIPLGMVVGAFFLVPYLGGIGLPLAIGLLWVEQLTLPEGQQMSWIWIIGGPSIVFAVVQVIETYILTPVIAGKATNLDPVTILVAVLAGGSVGGVYGMLLAIPAAACAKILVTDVLLPRIKAWTHGKASDPLPM